MRRGRWRDRLRSCSRRRPRTTSRRAWPLLPPVGVSDRHLAASFSEHGVTRCNTADAPPAPAKQCLTDTDCRRADRADERLRSLRRFTPPSRAVPDEPMRLRRTASARRRRQAARWRQPEARIAAITVYAGYRPPFDRAASCFVAQRAIPGIEAADASSIRRTVRAGARGPEPGWLEARFVADTARVRLSFAPALGPSSGAVIAAVRRWLDLDAAPDTIDQGLIGLPGDAGLRLPGSVDAFELAVRAVLGQQVTVAAARTLARRLVDRFGSAVATPWSDIARTFPARSRLPMRRSRTSPSSASSQPLRAIQALAAQCPGWRSSSRRARHPTWLVERLRELPGIARGPRLHRHARARGPTRSRPATSPPQGMRQRSARRRHAPATRTPSLAAVARVLLLRLWNSLGDQP